MRPAGSMGALAGLALHMNWWRASGTYNRRRRLPSRTLSRHTRRDSLASGSADAGVAGYGAGAGRLVFPTSLAAGLTAGRHCRLVSTDCASGWQA